MCLVPDSLTISSEFTFLQLFARLQKENPTSPHYHFTWIALSQLQAKAMPSDARMAQSLKMLASRSLQAAVDNTLADKVSFDLNASMAFMAFETNRGRIHLEK